MKIGFDAKRAFSNTSGLGNFSRNTIAALSKYYPDDRFYLFQPGAKRLSFKIAANTEIISPENYIWKCIAWAWRSFRLTGRCQALGMNVFHGLSNELPFGIGKSASRSVVTIHDLIYLRFPEYYKCIDRSIYDYKFRHSCRVATRIHAISEQTKQDIIYYFNVPEDKIQVIYQSVNPVFYEKVTMAHKLACRIKFQIPDRFILTVGTIEPRKNLLSLLHGMVSAGIDTALVVVGKPGKYKHQAEEYIHKHRDSLNVFFLSGVNDFELAVLYQMALLMVYPSCFEGFGLPVAEAQASGCPVITSNVSSMPEAGGDAAVYISPDDPAEIGQAVKNLISDSEARATLSAKGRINAQRFTPEKYASQMKELYNSMYHD